MPFPRDVNYSEARHEANGQYASRSYQIYRDEWDLILAYLGANLAAFLGRRNGLSSAGDAGATPEEGDDQNPRFPEGSPHDRP